MKKNLLVIFSIIFLFSLTNDVFAQEKNTAPQKDAAGGAPVPKAIQTDSEQDFYGVVEGNAYKNKFFGVKITLPEKWLAQESEVSAAIKEAGVKVVKGKNEQSEKALERAVERLTVLFTASKNTMGIGNNAIMSFSSEKAAPLMQIRNGEDYLRLSVQSFKKLQLPPDFKYSETIVAEKLGGENFYYLNVERNGYRQRFYATARKGYALFFTLSYVSDEDLETMKKIIGNSDFSWKE